MPKVSRLVLSTLWVGFSTILVSACADDELAALPVVENPPLVCESYERIVDDECIPLPGDINGRICDVATGTWRSGVNVTLTVDDGVLQTSTDTDGNFVFEEVPVGSYFIHYQDGEYEEQDAVVVGPGDTVTIGDEECIPPPGHIEGRVCHTDQGVWLPGANVSLNDESNSTTTTDSFGQFMFYSVMPGDYEVTISATDFERIWPVTVQPGGVSAIGDTECLAQTGAVQGRICGAEGLWLSQASVVLTLDDGTEVTTSTNSDGYFSFNDIPEGSYEVEVTKGSFNTTLTIEVEAGGNAILEEPICIPPVTRMAVITGVWDTVEEVITNLGYTVRDTYNSATPVTTDSEGSIDLINGDSSDFWLEDFLADPLWLAEYEIIFLNCGAQYDLISSGSASASLAITNLQNFIANGGSLYASDWAGEAIFAVFPDLVEFYGGGSTIAPAKVGKSTSNQSAEILDTYMASALGRTQVSINFDLPQWVVLAKQSAQPTDINVYVRGDVKVTTNVFFTTTQADTPIVVSFPYGDGKVVFTSAHNETQTSPDLMDILEYLVFEL